MNNLINFLANDKDEKFYLTESEEKEMLERTNIVVFNDITLEW
jgi:hypothetical protein